MSDAFAAFEARILSLYDGPARKGSRDDREFMAMVESFLGAGYDPVRVDHLQRERAETRATLASLAENKERIPPSEIAKLANDAITASLARTRKILGDRDFKRLFGEEATQPLGLVDARAIASRRAIPSRHRRQADSLPEARGAVRDRTQAGERAPAPGKKPSAKKAAKKRSTSKGAKKK
jgi:hypothetical protein